MKRLLLATALLTASTTVLAGGYRYGPVVRAPAPQVFATTAHPLWLPTVVPCIERFGMHCFESVERAVLDLTPEPPPAAVPYVAPIAPVKPENG